MITFFLPMIPRGQGRPRATVRGKHAAVYTAPKDAAAQRTLASLAAPYMPETPLDGPIAVKIVVYMPRPASMCGLSKRTGEPLQDPAAKWHTSKPDADNLAKLVLDGLRSFWRDDAQVCSLVVEKWIVGLEQQPGYAVLIQKL